MVVRASHGVSSVRRDRAGLRDLHAWGKMQKLFVPREVSFRLRSRTSILADPSVRRLPFAGKIKKVIFALFPFMSPSMIM